MHGAACGPRVELLYIMVVFYLFYISLLHFILWPLLRKHCEVLFDEVLFKCFF